MLTKFSIRKFILYSFNKSYNLIALHFDIPTSTPHPTYVKYICAQSKEDRQHPRESDLRGAQRRVSVGFPSRPTARVAMTLLCKSRKCRHKRAIGAALTLRKSSLPPSPSSSPTSFRLRKRQRTTVRCMDAGVIIWLVNFYCARRAPFLRESLRRCHVRLCQPLLRATLLPFFFSLPPSSSYFSVRTLFLFLWHRFTYRARTYQAYS